MYWNNTLTLILGMLLLCLSIPKNGIAYGVYNDTVQFKNEAPRNYIKFYQNYIGAVRGFQCPMYPTCSFYGTEVFNHNSVSEGFLMISDRLMRCGHEQEMYPLTYAGNRFQFLDSSLGDSVTNRLKITRSRLKFAFTDIIDSSGPDSAITFISYLINHQYYNEAILEILRLEQSGHKDARLQLNKMICLYALGKYEDVIFLAETDRTNALAYNKQILASQAAYKLSNYTLSVEQAQKAFNLDSLGGAESVHMQILGYAAQNQWNKVSEKNYNELSAINQAAAGRIDTIVKLQSVAHYKNPGLASVLSVVPGLGYYYAGHKQTALSALLLNGLLGYATYTSIQNKNYGMAALTGVFSASFYIGNIYGAGKSAKRYNKNLNEKFTSSIYNLLPF